MTKWWRGDCKEDEKHKRDLLRREGGREEGRDGGGEEKKIKRLQGGDKKCEEQIQEQRKK